jgi:hypothetical protein
VGDYVYLKVSPFQSTIRFDVKGKLAPQFVGPYKICKRVGKLAYKLELPKELAVVHLVFHVSQLRKCLKLPEEQVPTEALDLQSSKPSSGTPVEAYRGRCSPRPTSPSGTW